MPDDGSAPQPHSVASAWRPPEPPGESLARSRLLADGRHKPRPEPARRQSPDLAQAERHAPDERAHHWIQHVPEPRRCALQTWIRLVLTCAAEAIDQWFENLQNYEATLEEMAAASLDVNFKEELSAIEQCM